MGGQGKETWKLSFRMNYKYAVLAFPKQVMCQILVHRRPTTRWSNHSLTPCEVESPLCRFQVEFSWMLAKLVLDLRRLAGETQALSVQALSRSTRKPLHLSVYWLNLTWSIFFFFRIKPNMFFFFFMNSIKLSWVDITHDLVKSSTE